MLEDPKLGMSSLSPAIEEILDSITAEICRRRARGDARDVEFLSDIKGKLKRAIDTSVDQQDNVARQREGDLALIEAQGGLADRMRMSFLLSLLLAERGLVVLSDEGIALIADAMLPPAEARRRRTE